jgi:hypothetical protein
VRFSGQCSHEVEVDDDVVEEHHASQAAVVFRVDRDTARGGRRRVRHDAAEKRKPIVRCHPTFGYRWATR